MAKTILAIGAHIGDMELTCGGILASHAANGGAIVTLALTAGEKGNPPGQSVAEYRRQKVAEAQGFAAAFGGRAIVLDTPDGLLQHDMDTCWQVCDLIRETKPDAIVTHWRNSVHKDHAAANRIVMDARYYAGNPGFERPLPAHACPDLYFAENWEDTRDFSPYLYVDISKGYQAWLQEVAKHWFVTGSTDFRYLEYYDSLSVCRGCESGFPRAQALMVRELRDRKCVGHLVECHE